MSYPFLEAALVCAGMCLLLDLGAHILLVDRLSAFAAMLDKLCRTLFVGFVVFLFLAVVQVGVNT